MPKLEDPVESAAWEAAKVRPERPKTAPATPPPAGGRPAQAALPVGVRDGDLLIIGVGDSGMSDDECAWLRAHLRESLGLDLKILPILGNSGVTVLRPER